MRVDLFDFDLPPERIALAPASPRDAARMLVVAPDGALADRRVGELPDFLHPGDALVVNDTRVIAARLDGVRARGEAAAHIEATLIKRLDARRWRALARPARKLRIGERIRFGETRESAACLVGALDAEVEAKGEAGEVTLAFAFHGAALDQAIERVGAPPLPPYIASRRAVSPSDRADYQTVFAREDGAVAAPTAGLHFTPALLSRIEAAGASLHRVTLHVGAGTFLPVKADDTRDHAMHAEWGRIDAATAEALNAARARGGRIVAVGTTSARLIESAADEAGAIRPFQGETAIFITPGYRFRAVDALLTNFHLPRSTLFMLVGAFSGLKIMRRAYAHAIRAGYRFYSYGDACLLLGADRSRAGSPRAVAAGRTDI
jgi:S-adenosylmethionine:tRNA ribosyltransferase-isomerase